MAIEQRLFDNENELHNWVAENITTFFGDVLYVPGSFFITTKRNKRCKPDGYILDIQNSAWTIIESELLKHGVWEHIAEQIMRFIVAATSDATKRKIRDVFFDVIESKGLIPHFSETLGITQHRLIQRIENIIEGQTPDIAIFIDEVNEDLEEMIEALNATVKVFKIQKYLVNNAVEYLPPEGTNTSIETSVEEVADVKANIAETLELLGGGQPAGNIGNIRFYVLENDEKISIKYSKYYPGDKYYWYGITPSTLEKYENQSLSHLVFILGTEGVVKLPYSVLKEYLEETNKSLNPDETIRHYHVVIKNEPKHMLWIRQDKPSWDVEDYFFIIES